MNVEEKESMLTCSSGHTNPRNSVICSDCGLPLIDYRQETDWLLQRLTDKAVHIVPHIDGSFIGVGTTGTQVVVDFFDSYVQENPDISFLNIDSNGSLEIVPKSEAAGIRFHHYNIAVPTTGGTIYSGIGEQAVSQDRQLESYVRSSGIMREDAGQTVFVTGAIGGGTASGVGPSVAHLCKACNPEISIVAVLVAPSSNEADHIHLNAFYGISRMLNQNSQHNADMILLMNFDRLRRVRGIGRFGEELRIEKIVAYQLRLLQLNLQHSGIARMCRISKSMKTQIFVPCLAIGRSMEIFGSIENILESAVAFPLAETERNNVTASYLLLRIPNRLAEDFPEGVVVEEFEKWNKRHIPALASSLVQIVQTDDQSDRVDACVLLGGDGLSGALRDTIEGYRKFKTRLGTSARWDECGLSPQKLQEAEEVMDNYDWSMYQLRVNENGDPSEGEVPDEDPQIL